MSWSADGGRGAAGASVRPAKGSGGTAAAMGTGMNRTKLFASLALVLAACGGDGGFGGGTGATVGGVKDMRLARELIARGQIPPPAALLVEGMFAEHDLGLAGDPCVDTLCLRAAAGVAPDRDDRPRGWIQLGLSSNVDPALYRRPATTFIFTVDVSGSMRWGGEEGPRTPGELARELLHGLADRMTTGDQAAIVTYGDSVSVPLAFTADPARVHTAIDRLAEQGVTDMESGVRKALELGRAARARGEQVRVVLFTDVQPNVGATAPSAFEQMVADGAEDGVQLTVLGLGLGMGPEIMQSMAHVRGANAFGVIAEDDVARFLADEYPWFVAPIAYDLDVQVKLPAGLDIDTPYGFPTGFADDPQLSASSVFLSNRRGALLMSIEGDAAALDGMEAELDLGWTTPGGFEKTTTLHVTRGGAIVDERGQWFQQAAIERSTALALLVEGMHRAAEQYAFSPGEAEATMAAAQARFEADAAASGAEDLQPEVDLGDAMLELIRARAPQGELYGP